ncbi:MAG TPA: DUF6185 family protein [Thermoanaerobaculia bacterium]|nr:DUF6185 family protein [Thermoanaerobaculia bacterium]
MLTLQLSLTLPVQHPCVREAFSGDLQSSLGDFAVSLFGRIQIDGEAPAPADLQLTTFRDAGMPNARIQIEFRKPLDGLQQRIYIVRSDKTPVPAEDEISVAWETGIRVQSVFPVPDWKTSDHLSAEAWHPGSIRYFSLTLARIVDPGGQRGEPRVTTRQGLLQRLGWYHRMPVLSHLLLSIGSALPLLLGLLWLDRTHTHKAGHPLIKATGALLIFHFAHDVLVAMSQLNEIDKISNLMAAAAGRWTSHTDYIRFSPYFLAFVSTTILGIAVPILIWRRLRPLSPRSSRFLRWVPWGLIALVSGAALLEGAARLWANPEQRPGEPHVLVAIGFSFPLLGIFIALLLRGLAGGPVPSHLAPTCALTTGTLLVLNEILSPWPLALNTLWFVTATLLGAFLVHSLVETFRVLKGDLFEMPDWIQQREGRLLAILLLLLTAAPLTSVTRPNLSFARAWSVQDLAVFLSPWVLPVWIIGIVAILQRDGKESLEFSDRARALGLLAAAALLFSTRSAWAYIPVTFLLGSLILDRVLVRKPEPDLIPDLNRLVSGKRPSLIDSALDLNAAEQALRGHRRKQLAALLAGEVDFETYDREYEVRATKTAGIRERAKVDGQKATDLALALGPHASSWENGIHGAKYAALFSLPWIVFGFVDLLRSKSSQTPHPLLDLSGDLLLLVLRWVAIGFLLGYFFPCLPGRSGLAKGFFLFLGLTLPSLPMAVIWNASAATWQAALFFYLQTFIHCMLLGLFAFDLTALRHGGQGDWRLLFEIHGLPAVGASVSSIAVAIGAAVTALLNDQISGLVGAALRFALPETPVP